MGKWDRGTSHPSPSPFQYNCGENGEMGRFQFGDDFHPYHSPFPHFSPKNNPQMGMGMQGIGVSGENVHLYLEGTKYGGFCPTLLSDIVLSCPILMARQMWDNKKLSRPLPSRPAYQTHRREQGNYYNLTKIGKTKKDLISVLWTCNTI